MTVQPETPEPEKVILKVKVRWTETIEYEGIFEVHSDDIRDAFPTTIPDDEDPTLDDVMDYLTEGCYLDGEASGRIVSDESEVESSELIETRPAAGPPPDRNPAQLSIPEETA